ncbi:MAG: CBS domain-containing protein [Bacteroidia bacterium]
MLTKDLINNHISPLRLSDNGIKAMRKMKEFNLDHMPVVDNSSYLGLVAEKDILIKLSSLEKSLGESNIAILNKGTIKDSQPLAEVARLMAKENISLVPVLDEYDRYLGVVTLMDVFKYYNDSGMIQGPGGMIVLEMKLRDYSLSHISRIAEEEGAKIFNVRAVPAQEDGNMLITLKFNCNDLSRIVSSLNRHGYQIVESHHHGDQADDLMSRYDILMNFFNT